jgi:signal transduction histidine kinase
VRVLVVDDDEAVRTALTRALHRDGYEVSTAADGTTAIFDRFYRSATARSLPGSGLGLAIVCRIADVHGGTVQAIPLPRGVRFRLSVPETIVDPPAADQPAVPSPG